jgi:hypothetical protein
METNLKKLVSISSEALCDDSPQILDRLLSQAGVLGEQLIDLLRNKNGFYAFESALHVLPAVGKSPVLLRQRGIGKKPDAPPRCRKETFNAIASQKGACQIWWNALFTFSLRRCISPDRTFL